MEPLDSLSMALLDCVLRQADQDRSARKGPTPSDVAADPRARQCINSLLKRLASSHVDSLIKQQQHPRKPGRQAA